MGPKDNQRLIFKDTTEVKRTSAEKLEQTTTQPRQVREQDLIESSPSDFLPDHNSFQATAAVEHWRELENEK